MALNALVDLLLQQSESVGLKGLNRKRFLLKVLLSRGALRKVLTSHHGWHHYRPMDSFTIGPEVTSRTLCQHV